MVEKVRKKRYGINIKQNMYENYVIQRVEKLPDVGNEDRIKNRWRRKL